MPNLKPLEKEFYLTDTLTAARNLLGKIIVRRVNGDTLTARIVETEAYIGATDEACHAYGRITPRNSTLYKEGGISYVYFIYGNYYCFNAVIEPEGHGSAVLIRGVEPLIGKNIMHSNRGNPKREFDVSNGPGKLCMAMDIDTTLNEIKLYKRGELYIADSYDKIEYSVTRRIGLNVAIDEPYRFIIKDNPYVTKHKHNKDNLI